MDNDIWKNVKFTLGGQELGERKPPSREVLLDACNQLRVWRLCSRTACRRAQGCRKNPRACLERYAPIVPEAARWWVAGIMEAKRHDVPFEKAFAKLQPQFEALQAWYAIIDPPKQARVSDQR
jgi:hypothetical protein